MRKQFKLAVLAAATGLAAASAQAITPYNGDLLVGFTSASGNDFIYDIGAANQLDNGDTWNLSSYLGSFNLSTVSWGVIGDNRNSGYVWTTTGGLTPGSVDSLVFGIDTSLRSIYQTMPAAGPGNNESVDSTTANSWNLQTLNAPVNAPKAYENVYENPNVTGDSSTAYLYFLTDSEQTGFGDTAPLNVGSFTLSSDGILSYDPVPEPSTIGLLTGAGLLMVVFRNKFRRNHLA